MSFNITITTIEQESDLNQILLLQMQNHVSGIPDHLIVENGFLTVIHNFGILQLMNNGIMQIVAKDNGMVVGYALAMLRSFDNIIPALTPMYEIFKEISYKGKILDHFNYYVMGQICIAQPYREQGIFDKLYAKHQELYSSQFEICLTEISVRNVKSLKAHQRVGFEIVHTFKDINEAWNIVAWDWKSK